MDRRRWWYLDCTRSGSGRPSLRIRRVSHKFPTLNSNDVAVVTSRRHLYGLSAAAAHTAAHRPPHIKSLPRAVRGTFFFGECARGHKNISRRVIHPSNRSALNGRTSRGSGFDSAMIVNPNFLSCVTHVQYTNIGLKNTRHSATGI